MRLFFVVYLLFSFIPFSSFSFVVVRYLNMYVETFWNLILNVDLLYP